MSKAKKLKSDSGGEQKHTLHCILHASGAQHQEFTSYSDIKGPAADKLAQLHRIHDKHSAIEMKPTCPM